MPATECLRCKSPLPTSPSAGDSEIQCPNCGAVHQAGEWGPPPKPAPAAPFTVFGVLLVVACGFGFAAGYTGGGALGGRMNWVAVAWALIATGGPVLVLFSFKAGLQRTKKIRRTAGLFAAAGLLGLALLWVIGAVAGGHL
jgi:hypothetical protein